MASTIALVLIALGVSSRFLPHPHGAVAIGALAIYAGARLPRWWALAVPIVALFVSDIAKVWGTQYTDSLWSLSALVRYATFAVIVAVSGRLTTNQPWGLAAMSIGASTLFFLTTNFMSWATPMAGFPPLYARDLGGLFESYAAGIPFYRNSLAADLIGTGVLFGLDALANLLVLRSRNRLAVEPIKQD